MDNILNILIIIALVLIDQATKVLTVFYLKPIGTVKLIDGVISLTYAENTGAAFSMLENQTWLFVIITFITLGAMFYYYSKGYIKHKIGEIAFILVAGGAVGNLIDRVFHGFVVDMFEFKFMTFAIFNVADIFITFGGALLCYYILFLYDKDNEVGKNDN